MRTNKLSVILILLIIVPIHLLAITNTMLTTQSQVYKAAYALCIANGVNPPTSVSPLTDYEILSALDNIPSYKISDEEKELIELIKDELKVDYSVEEDNIKLNFTPLISPEFLHHTTLLDYANDYYQVKDRKDLIDLSLDLKMGDFLYAFGNWVFISPELADIHNINTATNFKELTSFQKEGILNSGIYLANEFSYGGIFKTGQSMGYGKTGNLMVSDNFSRQDFLRYKLHSNIFDYTLNLTQFDQAKLMDKTQPNHIELSNAKYNGMKQYQAVHRFEMKFTDNFQFVFQEGSMLNIPSFDTRMLNPFVYFHGLYNFSESKDYELGNTDDESNNYIVIETGYSPIQNLRINFQLLLDQIQVGGERTSPTACPEAYGALLNIESPWTHKNNYFNVYYEGVYIWPYTYLNLKEQDSKYNTNLDMITGYHNQVQDEIGYAGYTYGSDVITNSLGFNYGSFGLFDLDFAITYVIHGQFGYGYNSIIPPRGPANLSDKTLVGVGFKNAEHRVKVELNTTYYAMDALDITLGLAYLNVRNYRLDTNRHISDLQFKIALSVDPIKLISEL